MRWPWRRKERDDPTPEVEHAPPPSPAGTDPAEGGAVPADVIVFMHLPKCGGTSLHRWMEEVLAPGMLSPERLRLPDRPSPERIAALSRHRVFSGHFDVVDLRHFPGPQRRFTVLRDPVERIVSLYDYWRAFDPDYVEAHDLAGPRIAIATSFEEFVGDPHPSIVHDLDNTMVRTFAGRIRSSDPLDDAALTDAVAFVRTLDHVGHVDRLDDTVTWLCDRFGLPRAAGATIGRHNVRGEWTEGHLRRIEPTVVTPATAAAIEPLVRLDRHLIERTIG